MPEFIVFMIALLLTLASILFMLAESDFKSAFRCAVPACLLAIWLTTAGINYSKEVKIEKLPVTTYADTDGAKTYYYFNKHRNSLINIFNIGGNGSVSKTDDNKTSLPEKQEFVYVVSFIDSFSCGIYFGMFDTNVDIYTSLGDDEHLKSIYESYKLEK